MDDELRMVCELIRSTVSAYEAGKLLGLNPKSDGRCRCFFHGGDHRNLKLYGAGRGYYCFVCHEHGDVIRLVMKYLQCSFQEALEWLNESFDLRLDLNRDSYRNRVRHAETVPRPQSNINRDEMRRTRAERTAGNV